MKRRVRSHCTKDKQGDQTVTGLYFAQFWGPGVHLVGLWEPRRPGVTKEAPKENDMQ